MLIPSLLLTGNFEYLISFITFYLFLLLEGGMRITVAASKHMKVRHNLQNLHDLFSLTTGTQESSLGPQSW